LDKNNVKIPLTGLIFGRHHRLFDLCQYVQVKQSNSGEATILYVSENDLKNDELTSMFDSSNVDIDFHFEKISNPILTKSGKINLLVK
jgi:phenylacetate-CoA ligase